MKDENPLQNGKYYHPSIEEFYEGFEYEMYDNMGTWHKVKFDLSQHVTDFYEDSIKLDQGEYRVKYLDHSDILSAGWMEGSEKYYDFASYALRSYKMRVWWHKKTTPTIEITNYLDNVNFSGTIKNASELKRVMKMLNIL